MKKPNKIEEAKKLLAEEDKKKSEACAKNIEKVLAEYGHELVIVPSIIIEGRKPQIVIRKKEA